VAYDIADKRRLRKTYRVMCAHGDPLQYSVFQCDLTESGRVRLLKHLLEVVDLKQDRILIVDVGPADGRGKCSVEVMGKKLQWGPSDRVAVIV
jgi:CRISPR-associated protein Cas2